MKAVVLIVAVPLVACSQTVKRPILPTDAALELQQVTRSSDNEIDPSISPDGRSIAYTIATSHDAPKRVAVAALAQPDRPAFTAIGREPTWMPDGSGIVFVAKEKLVQSFGHTEHRPVFLADVGNPNFFAVKPTVAPSGKLVAMTMSDVTVRDTSWPSDRQIDLGIGVTDLGGHGVDFIARGTDPSFSPDGARIAYVKRTSDHEHLFVANADGSEAVQITEGPADDEQPSWSPDGKNIVFCSAHGSEDELTQANLFVVKADGSGLVQLTEGDRIACHPTWAKDGWVYFHANATGRFHIWRLRLNRTTEG